MNESQTPDEGRLRAVFRALAEQRVGYAVFQDPSIEEISAVDLCGEYPAVRYLPPDGFGFDVLTRLGDAFQYQDLEIEERDYDGVPVNVVTPRTLWLMKKDTARPVDHFDAEVLAERFGFREK